MTLPAHADHGGDPDKITVVLRSHIWRLRTTVIFQTGRSLAGVGRTDRMWARGITVILAADPPLAS